MADKTRQEKISDTIQYFVKNVVTTAIRKPPEIVGGTGGDNGKYGVYDDTGLRYHQHPCHAMVKYAKNPVVLFNRYVRREYIEDANREFFDFLISPQSPWRDFKGKSISHTSIEDLSPNKNGLLTAQSALSDQATKEWIYQNGWVWSDLSSPSNLQHSFLVASRMPAEWPKEINLWHERCKSLVTKDMTPVQKSRMQALVFAMNTVFVERHLPPKQGNYVPGDGLGIFQLTKVVKYDWPLDTNSATEEYVKNFCNGRVVGTLRPPFEKDVQYKPVNILWGDTGHYDTKDSYPRQLYDLYHDALGLKEEESKKYYEKDQKGGMMLTDFKPDMYWLLSEQEVQEVILSEYIRLFQKEDKVA